MSAETFEEIWSERELIERLRRQNPEHFDPRAPENVDLMAHLTRWIEAQEQLANSLDEVCGPVTTVWLNLRRARLYFKAGFLEASQENYRDAAELARQLGKDRLVAAILDKMKRWGL